MTIHPPESEKQVRTIVFSFNERYARYFSVTLASLIRTADPNCLYDIVILHEGLKRRTVRRLRDMVPEGIQLRFFDVRAYAAEQLGDLASAAGKGKWTISTFYDLLVPLLMPEYDRVLYCDADLVFCEDPGALFEMPFAGRSLIAVQDVFFLTSELEPENHFLKKQSAFLRDRLQITDPETYFNSGVFLFHIPAIDRGRYLERVRTALAFPQLPTVDQDVLNYVFYGDVTFAPMRWNVQAAALQRLHAFPVPERVQSGAEVFRAAAADPAVIHYTTYQKPWSYPDTELSGAFWEAAEDSPFRREILRKNVNALRKRCLRGRLGALRDRLLRRSTPQTRQDRAEYRAQVQKRLRILRKKLRLGLLAGMALLFAGCAAEPWLTSSGRNGGGSVTFSAVSGMYEEEQITVTLSAPEGYTVAYTLDGSVPTAADDTGARQTQVRLERGETGGLAACRDRMLYPEMSDACLLEDPALPSACVLRAAGISPQGETGETETHVYFLGEDLYARYPGCLILSVVTDPDNLLNYETGILTPGAIYDAWKTTDAGRQVLEDGAWWLVESNITQHGRAWEKPCALEIYDGTGVPAAVCGCGIRVTGHGSRAANQKSFNLYFRDGYGDEALEYELFAGVGEYESFRLLNGGNGADWLKFKSALLGALIADRALTVAESRPAILFLNGEYWGPYLLTEKLTSRMLADRYGVDPRAVILMKDGEVEDGRDEDELLYEELMAFAEEDFSDPAVWRRFSRIMNAESMADCFAARIYFGDADWFAGKNDVLWRTRDRSFDGGLWRYVLYDADFCAGLYGDEQTAPGTDHISILRERYPLFDAALESPEFRERFLASLEEIGRKNCAPERVDALLAEYLAVWEPLMPDYYRRFGNRRWSWEYDLDWTVNFFHTRYDLLMPFAAALTDERTQAPF